MLQNGNVLILLIPIAKRNCMKTDSLLSKLGFRPGKQEVMGVSAVAYRKQAIL